jgi:hypothetical protein
VEFLALLFVVVICYIGPKRRLWYEGFVLSCSIADMLHIKWLYQGFTLPLFQTLNNYILVERGNISSRTLIKTPFKHFFYTNSSNLLVKFISCLLAWNNPWQNRDSTREESIIYYFSWISGNLKTIWSLYTPLRSLTYEDMIISSP